MLIRNETAGDIPAISRLVTEAMLLLPQAAGTEARIVERLRADGALSLSLVAEERGQVIGHLAASAARIGSQDGWALIGPLAVLPAWHRRRAEALLWSVIRPITAGSASGPSPDCSFPVARPKSCRPCPSMTARHTAS